MTISPLVSVVMSTYDDAAGLDASIASVLAQTCQDFEFIIVNDGSPDPRTGQLLEQWAGRDSRICVITKPNAGLTRALIDGCAASRGAYIARMDVGDSIAPERLSMQVACLEARPEIAFVSSWTEFCGPEWEHLRTATGVDTGDAGICLAPAGAGECLAIGPTCHPSVMFRRSAYDRAGGYRWQFYYGQDWDLWLRLAACGRFHIVPRVLYRTRILPQGISALYRERQERIAACLRELWACRQAGRSEAAVLERAAGIRPDGHSGRRRRGSEGWYLVGEQLRRNGDVRCRRYLAHAIRQCPWDGRPWVRWVQSLVLRRAVQAGGGAP